MKISEMNNEQAAEAMIRLSVPFGNLCEDEKILEVINNYRDMQNVPMIQTIGKLLPELVTYAFKAHRDDLYEIIGALTQQNKEKVAKMNFVASIKVLKESYDDVLRDFFTSSKRQTKKTADESSQG